MVEAPTLLLNLHWLIRLRTWAIGGQLATLLLAHFALDILVLTGLLALTGGASNPFNFMYLVNLTLAAGAGS